MNNEKNNGKGIFYGVIGVATLIVAIIGATFAYFTASATAGENIITGNAASVSFDLKVTKVTTADETKGGMIPMTDGMLNAAVTSTKGACVDDTGAAVCQIYKVELANNGSAGLFLDGYVNLTGGLAATTAQTETTMRWAQVFTTDETAFTLTGTPALANGATGIDPFTTITTSGTSNVDLNSTGTTAKYTYSGNQYDFININYMRKSGHADGSYTRTNDLNSALVFNQRLEPSTDATNSKANLYFVVWLSETGTNQNPAADSTEGTNFFNGVVSFNSAAGGEVSATFQGLTRRPATDNNA